MSAIAGSSTVLNDEVNIGKLPDLVVLPSIAC
jgi:hypothetical protein